MQTPTQRWSILLVLSFFAGTTFLFFHLYTRIPKRTENITTATTIETPTVTTINPSRGLATAPITIVEYGDFQCEFCGSVASELNQLRLEDPEHIRIVWKDFPNEDLHPESTNSAIAARCAGNQGYFWSFHDLLFTRQVLNTETYTALAESLKLDLSAFQTCVDARTPLPRIQHDFEEGVALQLTATPTIFINDERIVGDVGLDQLRQIVNKHLSP